MSADARRNSKREYCDDLAWLGIRWEEPVRRQSEHFSWYEQSLSRLEKEHLVYPAFMSRGEMRAHITEYEAGGGSWPRDPDGVPLYPGLDKALSQRKRSGACRGGNAVRLAAGHGGSACPHRRSAGLERIRAARPFRFPACGSASARLGRRRPCAPRRADQLSSVGGCRRRPAGASTHVVRGLDLFAATAVHRVLQHLLGLTAPAYHHHRLILGPDGRKLSKSYKDTGIAALREQGRTPEEVRCMVGMHLVS